MDQINVALLFPYTFEIAVYDLSRALSHMDEWYFKLLIPLGENQRMRMLELSGPLRQQHGPEEQYPIKIDHDSRAVTAEMLIANLIFHRLGIFLGHVAQISQSGVAISSTGLEKYFDTNADGISSPRLEYLQNLFDISNTDEWPSVASPAAFKLLEIGFSSPSRFKAALALLLQFHSAPFVGEAAPFARATIETSITYVVGHAPEFITAGTAIVIAERDEGKQIDEEFNRLCDATAKGNFIPLQEDLFLAKQYRGLVGNQHLAQTKAAAVLFANSHGLQDLVTADPSHGHFYKDPRFLREVAIFVVKHR